MKKWVISLLFCAMVIMPNSFMYATETSYEGTYEGTYEFVNINVDNINKYLEQTKAGFNFGQEAKSDLYSGSAYISLTALTEGGYKIKYIEDGIRFGVKSSKVEGDRLTITLVPGNYGYDEYYTVSGVANLTFSSDKQKMEGTFTLNLPNGDVESSGVLYLEKKKGLFDGIFNKNDKNEDENKEDVIENTDDTTSNDISNNEEVKVTDILYETIRAVMDVGDNLKTKATIFPKEAKNASVKYTSSNTQVATVDSEGNITALSEGVCVITVQAQDQSDEMQITVLESEVSSEDKEKEKQGMTLFETKKDDFVEVKNEDKAVIESLSQSASKRNDIEEVKGLRSQVDGLVKTQLTVKEDIVIKKLQEKGENKAQDTVSYLKEKLRANKKSVLNAVDKIVSKVKPLDGFKSYIKEKVDDEISDLEGTRTKTEKETKDQLYKAFTNDNNHSVFETIKDKLTNNTATKAFSWMLDKITGVKKDKYTEQISKEHDEIKDRINKKISEGADKESAINQVKQSFSDEVISDDEIDAQSKQKTLWQKITYMFGGTRKQKLGIGSKTQYFDDASRFDKHVDLMEKNLEFE